MDARIDAERRNSHSSEPLRNSPAARRAAPNVERRAEGARWLTTNTCVSTSPLRSDGRNPRGGRDLVNQQVRRNLPVQTELMALEDAKEGHDGAVWRNTVTTCARADRGRLPPELCGGTHASRTGDIGLFRILSRSGTAGGHPPY
ncbi:hypothetical protein M8494_22780 [Serratia ureilytica]